MVGSLPANAGDTGSSPGLGRSHMLRSSWAREPQLLSLHVWSLCSATREAAIVRSPRTVMKSGPRLPQLEKALAQKRRLWGFPGGAVVESLPASSGGAGSGPGLGGSHMPRSGWARGPQLLSLCVWSLCSATSRGRGGERPAHRGEEWPPLATA